MEAYITHISSLTPHILPSKRQYHTIAVGLVYIVFWRTESLSKMALKLLLGNTQPSNSVVLTYGS